MEAEVGAELVKVVPIEEVGAELVKVVPIQEGVVR